MAEQRAHHQPVSVSDYTIQMGRDTLENWQSEFPQLLWQVFNMLLAAAIVAGSCSLAMAGGTSGAARWKVDRKKAAPGVGAGRR